MWVLDPVNSPELIRQLRAHVRGDRFEVAWVGEGWRVLVQECHQRLEHEFPDYELLAVKQKEGVLAFQAFPRPSKQGEPQWTSDEFRRLGAITSQAQKSSESVCEWCGSPGNLREERSYIVTLCDDCDKRFSDPPGPQLLAR